MNHPLDPELTGSIEAERPNVELPASSDPVPSMLAKQDRIKDRYRALAIALLPMLKDDAFLTTLKDEVQGDAYEEFLAKELPNRIQGSAYGVHLKSLVESFEARYDRDLKAELQGNYDSLDLSVRGIQDIEPFVEAFAAKDVDLYPYIYLPYLEDKSGDPEQIALSELFSPSRFLPVYEHAGQKATLTQKGRRDIVNARSLYIGATPAISNTTASSYLMMAVDQCCTCHDLDNTESVDCIPCNVVNGSSQCPTNSSGGCTGTCGGVVAAYPTW